MMNLLNRLNALVSSGQAKRAAHAIKLAIAAVSLFCVLGHLAGAPRNFWNGARLAPTFSILAGHPPYYPMDRGPILNTLYGPFTDFYYLPCGIFYKNVTLAILTGSLLSLVAFVVPVTVILWRRRERLSRVQSVWLGTLCVLQIFSQASVSYSAFYIHADSPAVLFATLCALLLEGGPQEQPSWRAIFLSAAFGTLAAWSKQTVVPILILPLAAAWAKEGAWRLRIALFGWMAALSGLIFLMLALWCGGGAVLDNLWRIPAAHPLSSANFLGIQRDLPAMSTAVKLKSAFVEMHVIAGKYLALYVLGIAAVVLIMRVMNRRTQGVVFQPRRLSALLFGGALLTLPGGAAGLLKAGGFINCESPFAWFIVLGFLSLITDHDPGNRAESPGGVLEIGRIIYPIFAAIGLLGLAGQLPNLQTTIHQIAKPFDNDQETAVRVTRQFPEQYYFPWHPLAGLIGEGKLYHFEYGVMDRVAAGKGPTADHFNANIPAKASVMAWPKGVILGTNDFPHFWPTNGPAGVGTDQFDWFSFDRPM